MTHYSRIRSFSLIALVFCMATDTFLYSMERTVLAEDKSETHERSDSVPDQADEPTSTIDTEVATCRICLSECSSSDNQHPSITLSCSHTTHKSCLENFYKSLHLINPSQQLTCIFCKKPLIEDDLKQLNITITVDNQYQYLLQTVTSVLTEERLAFINMMCVGLLRSPGTQEMLADFFDNESDLDTFKNAMNHLLPLNMTDIRSGDAFRRLRNIAPFSRTDVRHLLQALARQGYLDPQNIATWRAAITRMADTFQMQPLVAPLLNTLSLLLDHIDSEEEPPSNNLALERFLHYEKKLEVILISFLLNPAINRINSSTPLSADVSRWLFAGSFITQGIRIALSENYSPTLRTINRVLNSPFPLRLDQNNIEQSAQLISDMIHNTAVDDGRPLFREEALDRLSRLHPEIAQRLNRLPFNVLLAQRNWISADITQITPPRNPQRAWHDRTQEWVGHHRQFFRNVGMTGAIIMYLTQNQHHYLLACFIAIQLARIVFYYK